jgi:hypothetical protein
MALDCFIYLLLAWYIENVNPSYGIPLPWNYPLKLSYWFGMDYQDMRLFKWIFKTFKLKTSKYLSVTEQDQSSILSGSNKSRSKSKSFLFESEPLNLLNRCVHSQYDQSVQ